MTASGVFRRSARRGLAALASGVVAAALLASPVGRVQTLAAPQDPVLTFRASADFVGLDVSVQRAGRPVTGLLAADFIVLDNGVRQDVADVSYERLPIDVTVALDVSASVTGPVLDQLRQAVRQLEGDLGRDDRLRMIAFNMQVALLADFAPAASHRDTELDGLQGGGGSSILDAVAVALATPAPTGRRQMIVLFTDGEDSSSITSAATVLDVARRTTPTLHVVLAAPPELGTLRPPQPAAREVAAQQVFARLAAETGGTLVSISRGASLASMFRRSLDEFRASYVLHFVPRGVELRGAHTLSVRINRPGTFDVRARSGYVWR